MTCLLYKHKQFFITLSKLRKNTSKLYKTIKNSKVGEIKAIGELSYNILKGGVSCSRHKKKQLQSHVKSLRFLADKKISLRKKKTQLLKGGGLFLTSLLPLAIKTIFKNIS